jgi:hypothetical protein
MQHQSAERGPGRKRHDEERDRKRRPCQPRPLQEQQNQPDEKQDARQVERVSEQPEDLGKVEEY